MSKVQRISDVLVDRLEQEKEVSAMDKKILMKQKSVTAFERKEGQVSVMKNCRKYFLMAVFACIMLAGTLFVEGTTRADAATRKGYIIGTSNVRVYSNTALTRGYGWIYPTDIVTVYTVTDRYSYVGYPAGNRVKKGYIATSAILLSTGGNTYKNNVGSFDTYIRPGAGKFGTSTKGDTIATPGSDGADAQVKYNVSNYYKYAFALTSDIDKYVFGKTGNTLGNITAITESQAKDVMFNAKYYANMNPDLKAAFGYDSNKLYNHYVTCGIKEGRSASPIFDPVYYLNNNPDLRNAFGNNYTAAYNHWIQYGCAEGRDSSKYYNGYYYRSRNLDLERAYFSSGDLGYSYYRLACHYLEYGIGERRWANSNGYIPTEIEISNGSSGNVGSGTYSISGNILTVNGVAMTDYIIGGKYTNSNYAIVNGKSVYMAGSQCCGYARYIAYKLYGCHDKSAPGKFKDVAGYVAAGSLTSQKLKSAVTAAGVGAHFRTNGSQHSMSIIEVTDSGFTVTDANSDGKNTIKVTSYTWDSYVNGKYGKRGILYIKKYVG